MSDETATVEALIARGAWRDERQALRCLLLERGLEESVKWGKPCYRYDGANLAILFAFKSYCAIGFLKGAILSDEEGLLVAPGAHSQAMRQLRFTGLDEVEARKATISAYIDRAIQAEKDGLKIEFSEKETLPYPEELIAYLEEAPDFAEAFGKLTPGRRRGHILNYGQAKQSKTRQARIERSRPQVMQGKGPTGR